MKFLPRVSRNYSIAKYLTAAVAPILALTLVTGCAQREVKEEQFSGFLGDYSGFEQLQAPDGVTVVGWVSPDIGSNYNSLMIDPVIVYPPRHSFDRFSEADVAKALAYLNQGLTNTLGQQMTLTTKPGPGVLRMRAALTTASIGFKPMKWYNFVPVSAVAVAAGEATGLRDEGVQLIIEVEILDSVTSKRVAATARMGSSTVEQGKPLEMGNLEPLLDEWIKAAGQWFDRYLSSSISS